MGGSQSTVSVTEDFLPVHPPLETNVILKDFVIMEDGASSSNVVAMGGGIARGGQRMYRTYRVRHVPSKVTAVLKTAYLQRYNAEMDHRLESLSLELQNLRNATKSLPHICPVMAWFAPSTFKGVVSVHPTAWLRPYVYTTLSDRLIHGDRLENCEKWFWVRQLFEAVQSLHDAGVVHGSLTTQNIGCTSAGWLVLMDVMPAQGFRPVLLPNDDPTEYLYCFSKNCYLAPERFDSNNNNKNATLTMAMDIFSLGCCLVELALNGEACFDLGQLLEYRKLKNNMSTIFNLKLQKMESSALRAACRHMLHWNPTERLPHVRDYWLRLKEQQVPPAVLPIYDFLYQLLHNITQIDTPDARLHRLYLAYPEVILQTRGIPVPPLSLSETTDQLNKPLTPPELVPPTTDLWEETQALLKELDLEAFSETPLTQSQPSTSDAANPPLSQEFHSPNPTVPSTSPAEQSCLLIYVQQILSTMRHVQRPATKIMALRLLDQLVRYVSDEVRLQRIVPVLVGGLLKDSDAWVRATTLDTLTRTLLVLTSFPPSDAQVMPRYILKRVAPLLTDSCLSVRVCLASNMGGLAETALRFLDISHAVRLVQAVVEGGASSTGTQTPNAPSATSALSSAEDPIFEERVTQLLDATTSTSATMDSGVSSPSIKQGTIFVRNTYQAERSSLADTLSRWVVHICTDQSEHASLVKRALLTHSLPGLCNFFSLDGVMGFMLPQLLAFLNDRQDWQLRAALFSGLPFVCQIIGRGATEEFVMPCLEIGLVDCQEQVICSALFCLARIIELGLLSRALVVQPAKQQTSNNNQGCILERYSAFLIHPSKGIRQGAIRVFCATSRALGSPDSVIYVTPILHPFLRFSPPLSLLSNEGEMIKCLKKPWSRAHFSEQLGLASVHRNMPWETVVGGVKITEMVDKDSSDSTAGRPDLKNSMDQRMQSYLKMLAKNTQQVDTSAQHAAVDGIEGSLKLAQSVVFPRRASSTLPDWFRDLRDKAENEDSLVSEPSAIRSVSGLGSVYGISIMGPGATEHILGAAESREDVAPEVSHFLDSQESKTMEEALMGKWESGVLLDPDVVDTALLVTKLKALHVPTLGPQLGTIVPNTKQPRALMKDSVEWKPKMNCMIASSSPIGGHTAPVVRLAVALDSSFFVSASHDGTCGVWEVSQLEHSSGFLEKSTAYSGHHIHGPTRVNDLAMVEGTSSVVSGSSNGAVHVWRVDLVSPSSSTATTTTTKTERRERPRVVGTSCVREANLSEGEILAVSHFNSMSSSVIVYATQKGMIRTWDLRSAEEPFSLAHGPKLGLLSAMALGGDRNWIVTGTSRGFVVLWDVRFQQPFKLWRHSRGDKICRLASCIVPHPQTWETPNAPGVARPYVFVGSPNNECSMFDVLSGSCAQCFRTVSSDPNTLSAAREIPSLLDVSGRMRFRNGILNVVDEGFEIPPRVFSPAIHCMVGSLGGGGGGHGGSAFLLTGGSDGCIRFWDFSAPSRCYMISGAPRPRPSMERIDLDGSRRLMVCRQHSSLGSYNKKPPEFYHHTDSIEDLKVVDNSALISCSRDCTVKVWR